MVQTMTAFLDLEHSWSFLGENLETNKHIRDKCNIVLLQLYTQVLKVNSCAETKTPDLFLYTFGLVPSTSN